MKKLTLIILSLLFCFVLFAQNNKITNSNLYKGEVSDMTVYFIENEENISPISSLKNHFIEIRLFPTSH